MKKIFTLLLSISLSILSFAQGAESFTNMPASVSAYAARNWVGDGSVSWTAGNARTDGPTAGSAVSGMNSRFVIMRNTTGILSATSIPNGINTLTFLYAKAFTAGTGIPTFGVFINGTQIGSTITASSNTAQTATFTPNISGTFSLEIRQLTASDNGRLALDDITWTSNAVVTPCVEPTSQPTGPIVFTASATSITGTFTAAAPAPDQYIIIRSTNSTLSANPIDGVDYTAGTSIGGGTVVALTSLTTFTDNGLTPNSGPYYYFIFSVNNDACGTDYLQLNPLTGNQTTPPIPACITPAAAPSPISLTSANTSISGSFPLVGDANRYLVVISTSATLSAAPVDGTTYTAGQTFGGGKIVSFSSNNTFVATGLLAATQYYIFVFAANADCTGAPFYSTSSSNTSITTTNSSQGIPPGYYDAAAGLTCQPLKTAVRDIISTGFNSLGYTPGIWNIYLYSDMHRNDANTADILWDMYSDNPTGPEPYVYSYGPPPTPNPLNIKGQCGTYSAEGGCYNREHSTPQSWFNQVSPMVSDVHHIFATDGKVNGVRSNFPYGEVTTATSTSLNGSKLGTGNNFGYTATVFEPINEYKGDFARAGLYMAVRYENEIISQNWSGFGNANQVFLSTTDQSNAATRKLQIYDDWYLKLLYKWHVQDPVSQKEIDRNNAIYYQAVAGSGGTLAQGNRNPFVDHPEYAAAIWGNACLQGVIPVTFTDVNAKTNKDGVLVNWNIANEININYYEVERSNDGASFYTVGNVPASNIANYNFIDKSIQKNGVVFYRIKALGFDGKINLSKIVSVKIYSANGVLVYPNPATSTVNIKFSKITFAKSNMQITDITGKLIKQQTVNANENNIVINTSNLAAGKYFIKIINGTEVIIESFVVAK